MWEVATETRELPSVLKFLVSETNCGDVARQVVAVQGEGKGAEVPPAQSCSIEYVSGFVVDAFCNRPRDILDKVAHQNDVAAGVPYDLAGELSAATEEILDNDKLCIDEIRAVSEIDVVEIQG